MDRISTVEAIRSLLTDLGCDLSDPNFVDTPDRILRMLQDEFLLNINKEIHPDTFKTFPNDKGFDEIIHLDNIPFTSLCSHHFLPFSGLAHLLYIPDKLLIGASKPARIIDFFCRKPQLQENLGIEIVDAFEAAVRPKGVMLYMRGVHSCMSCRGVKTGINAGMGTSITRGVFRSSFELEMKGFQLIQLSK
jgi:GTP cyclohydrolase I